MNSTQKRTTNSEKGFRRNKNKPEPEMNNKILSTR
jgi:hypothetical protein